MRSTTTSALVTPAPSDRRLVPRRPATRVALSALILAVLSVVATIPSSAQDRSSSESSSGSGTTDLVSGATYLMSNVDLDRYLASASDGNRDNVVTTDAVSDRAVWEFVDNGDKTWGLRNVATNGWLDGDGRRSDWNVDQSASPGRDDRWRIVPLGQGEYELINAQLHRRLDADRGHMDWNVDLAVARRGDRKWMIEPAYDDANCNTVTVPGLVASQSRFDMDTTWDRLVAAVDTNPNLRIIARVDHAAAAQGVGLTLAPNRVLVFGNPALGTPLMQDQRSVALDLPQKMHVWLAGDAVCVAFNAPDYLVQTHELGDLPQLAIINGALRNLAGAATGRMVDGDASGGARPFTSTLSGNNFETTWANLLAAIEASPANLAFSVDHAANSGGVLEPTRLAVFGNPNIGTPLMELSPTIGIDLPLKMVVWGTGSAGFVRVEVLDADGLAQRHGIDPASPALTPIRNALTNFERAAITPPAPTPTPTVTPPPPRSCVVGDGCPPQRPVNDQGRCIITSAFGNAGDSLFVGDSCDDRPQAFHDPTRQVTFASNGTISVNGLCLTRAGADPIPRLRLCTGAGPQVWVVNADGTIVGDSLCLAVVSPAERQLQMVDCALNSDPRWGFIPIGSTDPYEVRQVYVTATDSVRGGRSGVLQDAVESIRNDWVRSGATWQVSSSPTVLTSADPCSAFDSLADVRRQVIRELSLLGEFSYNTKYNVVAECPQPGEAASASFGVAVYAQSIFDLTEQQINIDRNGAANGEMSEVGVFGHELGHSLGLPHENCAIGGWQGGIDEQASFAVRGLSQAATEGPMCNGAYYPNVDTLADYQLDLIFERSCAWISECTDTAEYAADGRPYICGQTGVEPPQLLWETTVAGQLLTFDIYRYTLGANIVAVATGVPWASAGYVAIDYVPTEDNYLAIGLSGAPPAERQYCGKWQP